MRKGIILLLAALALAAVLWALGAVQTGHQLSPDFTPVGSVPKIDHPLSEIPPPDGDGDGDGDESSGPTSEETNGADDGAEHSPEDAAEEAGPRYGGGVNRRPITINDLPAPAPTGFENYKAILEATPELMLPGLPGDMKVWIGAELFAPTPAAGLAHDEALIPARGQQSATVNPWSAGFIFTPAKSDCFLLTPEGTPTRFTFAPNKSGTFRLGADVYLYDSKDCSGTATPREANTLEVKVTVNKKQLVLDHLAELWDLIWEGVVVLVAAFFIALFRKKLAKLARKFGIKLPEKSLDE